MNDKFLKPYNPTETEARIYEMWEKSGYFNPDKLPERNLNGEPYSIVLPPPNVTGTLHLGHATAVTVGDIMIRHARMNGRRTLWVPGTDHAAIATQSKVEKEIMKKEGKSRHDLGREELLKRVDAFAAESHDTIVNQIKKMGSSIDWSREAFTLDDKRSFAVRTAFKKMYDDGLIYRGFRVVNWDPKGQTTISDDEIVYEARTAKLYTFKYGKDTTTGEIIPISISTTRPETKLGDTAIAVHPDDPRYSAFIGKEYDTIFAGAPVHLRVIADQNVEKDFGTGALGVTPAHSQIDWDMAQTHSLPLVQVINEYAKMTTGYDETTAPKPEFIIKGKKTTEAREAVVAWLRDQGLLEKEEDAEQNVSTAERTGGIIEPLPKLQWFIGVNKKFKKDGKETTLKELMKEAVEKGLGGSGQIKIIPDRFEKVYFSWIENLRDWCISRQIWYGHRIPVWYKGEEIYCGVEAPAGEGWKQDEDTLDTWFSSGLWTFSTLGWPEQTDDLKRYYPTTVLETGRDILFFWIARMILMSSYLLGEVPFKTVYLNGLVLNKEGKKMSKSSGNNLDPLELIAEYGADAVRMSLIVGVGPGNDSKHTLDKVKAYKLFSNKLWNIARFTLSAAAGERYGTTPVPAIAYDPAFSAWTAADTEHVAALDALIKEVTTEMDEYKFYLVGEKLYHYVWDEMAAKIIEESKPILNGDDAVARTSRTQFLLRALTMSVKLLHPFMPFITEEIWQEIGAGKTQLIVEKWPQA